MDKQQIIDKLILDIQLRGLSKDTKIMYSQKAQQFQEYFNKPASELGEKEIREYLHYLSIDKKLCPSTVNGCNSAIRFLFDVTLEKNLNYKRIPRLKEPILLPNILSRIQVQALIDASSANLKHKCILMLIYGSGLRISEAASLKISDIDSDNMRIFVSQGKGKRDRYTLLSQLCLETLREYWKQYKPKHWLFCGMKKDSHATRRSIQEMFKNYLKKSCINKNATVHTLRHSFATHLFENGTSIFYIRQLLGHATLWSTTRYLHVAITDILKTTSPMDILRKDIKPKIKSGEKSNVKEVKVYG